MNYKSTIVVRFENTKKGYEGKYGIYFVVKGNRVLGAGEKVFETKTEAVTEAKKVSANGPKYCEGRIGRFMGSDWVSIQTLVHEVPKAEPKVLKQAAADTQ